MSRGNVTYFQALDTCKCGCLKSKSTNDYHISNSTWERSQSYLFEARQCYSNKEKEAIIKQSLYTKLKEQKFENESSHVKLEFSVNFVSDDKGSQFCTLCESCYVKFNDLICDRTWANWKKTLKKNILVAGFAAEASAVFRKQIVAKGGKARYETVDEARAALEPLGYTDEEFFQWACVKNTDAAREAYMWLYKFISLVGDNAPNRRDKIQLPGIYTKESIHTIYRHHIITLYSGNEHEPLDIRSFEEMWQNIFPNVSITKYCQVSGKCYHCHSLYERQEVFTCEADLVNIRKLANIHKIMIEMQRGAYMRNRELAQTYPNLYMSLIIDGMSQDHCILPFLAQKHKDSVLVKQKIVGAKQHGFSKSIYRLFPHVNTGGNVACEVLLHEIEKRMDYCTANNLPFPRTLFLQIDGGSENTSRTFYGLCEDLVRQGVFDRIEAARLPVGHTHEDIDAMFGVLWKAAQGKTIISPQQWKEMAMAAFNQAADSSASA